MNVLFVCTGNTCRSSMAAVVAQALYPDWEVDSAGTGAWPAPMARNAELALEDTGYDPGEHVAKPLDKALLAWADLVIAMGDAHKRAVLAMDPEARVVTLKEAAGRSGDLPDPFGADLTVYKQTLNEIEALIKEMKAWDR